MYIYGRFMLVYGKSPHNIVNYPSIKIHKYFFKNERLRACESPQRLTHPQLRVRDFPKEAAHKQKLDNCESNHQGEEGVRTNRGAES